MQDMNAILGCKFSNNDITLDMEKAGEECV